MCIALAGLGTQQHRLGVSSQQSNLTTKEQEPFTGKNFEAVIQIPKTVRFEWLKSITQEEKYNHFLIWKISFEVRTK